MSNKGTKDSLIGAVGLIALWVSLIYLWLNSIVNSIHDNDVLMVLVVMILPPIGVIHGIGVLLGWG